MSGLCAAAVVLAGYGGGGHAAASTRRGFSSSIGHAASKTPSATQRRLLESHDLSGFTPGDVATYSTPREWVSSPSDQESKAEAAAEKAMLIREGFQVGVTEQLAHDGMAGQGLSLFEQFRSAATARSALAYYISDQKKADVQAADGTYKSFKVSGIPGAVGFSVGGTAGGINIAFADGKYYYLVGREGGTPHDVAGLKTAAQRLYRRVHG